MNNQTSSVNQQKEQIQLMEAPWSSGECRTKYLGRRFTALGQKNVDRKMATELANPYQKLKEKIHSFVQKSNY